MTDYALAPNGLLLPKRRKLILPRFEPWRLLRPLKLAFGPATLLPRTLRPVTLEGQAAAAGVSLIGYGHTSVSGASFGTINYSTVDSGSAPSAGDWVVWFGGFGNNATGSTANNWSGSWLDTLYYTDLAVTGNMGAHKVIASSDISSPITPVTSTSTQTDDANYYMWIAFRGLGSSPTVTQSTTSTLGNPTAQNVNASGDSAPLVVISTMCALKTSDTALSGVSWTGATQDAEIEQSFNVNKTDYWVGNIRYKIYNSGSGDSVTADIDDNGLDNTVRIYKAVA